ncbi:MAG: hypothetical protein Q4Q58_03005 [Thermoplasmata archaeon]|nr:hypothetical protein [Thermoplasmata archaeon]
MASNRTAALAVAAICIIAVAAAAIILHNNSGSGDRTVAINEDVVAMTEFSVSDDSVGTHAEGSVIVQRGTDSMTVRIIGSAVIGEGDFGGVCIYSESMLWPGTILAPYIDGQGLDGALAERIPGETPFPGGYSVSFGRVQGSQGGCEGFFEIVYEYTGDSVGDVGSLSFGIAVGSYYDGDVPVAGHVYESVVVEM